MTYTLADLSNIAIAVALRAEACEENEETADARRWRRLQDKTNRIMGELQEGGGESVVGRRSAEGGSR